MNIGIELQYEEDELKEFRFKLVQELSVLR